MKRLILTTLFICGLCASTSAQNDFIHHIYDYIGNTTMYSLNQEEGRSYFIPENSISLNGNWKFYFGRVPEDIPDTFFQPAFNDRKWSDIDVPSNWEMRGFGDKQFRNVAAPFNIKSYPQIDKDNNPTGAYRRSLNIPTSWDGSQIFLRMEKTASASWVWINGKEVGYNEGGQEPAEYDITKFVNKGTNSIAVLVTKYSDGYYLEGQDYWRLAGIFDDVTVYATPKTRLFDWYVVTDLDDEYKDADLKVEVTLKRYDTSSKDFTVKAFLTDSKCSKVAEFGSTKFTLNKDKMVLDMSQPVSNPAKWTSETPSLYNLELQLVDATGKIVDKSDTKIGFKETCIEDGVFYLNGKTLKINAINSHMQHPENGHAMDEATIRKDMELLKQFNFNAVRTCHYPPVNKYLQLANEYGLYIIDETGDEAHATEKAANDLAFTEMYKERVRMMVLRDRNYPCVLMWSAGNESGEGFNITEVIKEGRIYDNTRSWMYGGNAYSHPAEDIIGPRYPSPLELEMNIGLGRDGDTRPSFMDEYLSVAGNACGGMDEYWDAIYTYPRSAGGAIWDFVSPGLTEKVRQLQDRSQYNTPVNIMGNAQLVSTSKNNKVLDINGFDQWVEVYRGDNVELTGSKLGISFEVKPRERAKDCGTFVTKGSNQFGVVQNGNDQLAFYIYTDNKYQLNVPLPADWYNNWHKVLAQYDDGKMSLSIDGKIAGTMNITEESINAPQQSVRPSRGRMRAPSTAITNTPYPINIGRNIQAHGQNFEGCLCDAQIDNLIIAANPEPTAENAVLYLDFQSETENGNFYTYGIGARTYGSIWPDRRPQPEMWQMKKTTQPLKFTLISAEDKVVEVWNRNHFLDADYYDTEWALQADGKILQSGKLTLDVKPLEKAVITIPFSKPEIEEGVDYRILITSCLKEDQIWAVAGHEVSWDQLDLPWHKTLAIADKTVGNVQMQRDEDGITVSGDGFEYFFDKNGKLTSVKVDGGQMLNAPLQLNVWRAPIANELDDWDSYSVNSGNRNAIYGAQIAAEFYSYGLDRIGYSLLSMDAKMINGQVCITVRDFRQVGVSESSAQDPYIVSTRYKGFQEKYEYKINGDGTITLKHTIDPQGTLPILLPRIGLQTTLSADLQQVEYYGRGPQENYSDRKTGYKIGEYSTTVDDMYEPYLIPQDYGLRMDTRRVQFCNKNGKGIALTMYGDKFNFNAYPYSTDNLTKAIYQYQLQHQDGITFNLDYATTGVGCSSRYVLPAYFAMPLRYERTMTIKPVR